MNRNNWIFPCVIISWKLLNNPGLTSIVSLQFNSTIWSNWTLHMSKFILKVLNDEHGNHRLLKCQRILRLLAAGTAMYQSPNF